MIIYSYIMFNIRMKNLSKSGLSPSVYASKIGPTFMSVFTILLLIVTFVLDYNIWKNKIVVYGMTKGWQYYYYYIKLYLF